MGAAHVEGLHRCICDLIKHLPRVHVQAGRSAVCEHSASSRWPATSRSKVRGKPVPSQAMLAPVPTPCPACRAPDAREHLPDTVTNAVVLQALVKMADEASDSAEVTSWAIAFFAVEKEHTQCLIMLGAAPQIVALRLPQELCQRAGARWG